jgi:putative DNA primase/helicase
LTEGGIVERYLRWRGIMVPISTLHDLRQRDDEMVAVIRAPGGVAKQLHRTVFKGKDRTRLFWPGPLPAGGAVRLMEHGDTLGIAEGIETALSASVLFGMPCWAALNANQMACWVAPKEIKSVIIFGDHDTSFDGQRAAYHLAKRLLMKQISVDVRFPGITVDRDWIDKDWNDVIRDYSGPGLAPNGAAVA